jgi:dinuclear metal center YbgI/SA1388 family protein
MTVNLKDVTAYLDEYLGIADVHDSPQALNGLQVENTGKVTRVAVAVDVCRTTIDRAVEMAADFMVVHHGLFWGGLQPLVAQHGHRVRTLIKHDIALYSAHLPLDLHPEVGNNAVLARALGLDDIEPFGEYEGQTIGFSGTLVVSRAEFAGRIRAVLGFDPKVIATGPETVNRVGIVSGGAGKLITQVAEAGLDTYVTGEGSHHTYFDAEEAGVNLIYAGHYATETVGVKALAHHMERRFGLPWEFIDHPTGL